ncbi:MAG: cohesin domain-containing protein, partial [Pyrinomonadaceae bacterium]|nr:cohesin domain-containing protein [Pyrinomonadaceae bacterium]
DYSISGLGTGAYTVTPSKSAQPIGTVNGISPSDSALIAQYGAGFILLNANQLLAADVTNNGTVSPLDAAYIAQWSVGIANPGITGTWKFVPASRNYANVETAQTNQDYSAILMGDVTGNWNPAGPGLTALYRADEEDAVAITAPQFEARQGTTVRVPVTIGDISGKGVIAYQFDVAFDPTVIEPADVAADIEESLSSGMNLVFNSAEPGLLRVAVYGIIPIEGKGVLMNLNFDVVGAKGSGTELVIKTALLNEGSVKASAVNGKVGVIESAEPGSISGRLISATGKPVGNARILLTDTMGNRRSVISNGFGEFEASGFEIGQTITIQVYSKEDTFTPRTVSITGDLVSLDMIADQ